MWLIRSRSRDSTPISCAADPGRLADEAGAIGLFGGKRLIWVRGAGNDRVLIGAVGARQKLPETTTVIIEAGELKKGTALRRAIEETPEALAVPCYADESRVIHALIDEELGGAGLRITPAARQRLTEALGADRLASRGELRKLALYCHGSDQVTEEDVLGERRRCRRSLDRRRGRRRARRQPGRAGHRPAAHHGVQDRSPYGARSPACASSSCWTCCAARWLSKAAAPPKSWRPAVGISTSAESPPWKRRLQAGLLRESAQAMDHFQRALLGMRRSPSLEHDLAWHALLAAALRSSRAGQR